MKLKALVLPVTAAVLLTLGAPARAACPTEGCPAQSVGTIEAPAEGALVSGYVRVVGFALNGALVSNVDLYIDGMDEVNRVTPAGGANINMPRPDVMQAFEEFVDQLKILEALQLAGVKRFGGLLLSRHGHSGFMSMSRTACFRTAS